MVKPIQRWLATNQRRLESLDSIPWHRAGLTAGAYELLELVPGDRDGEGETARADASALRAPVDCLDEGTGCLILGEVGSGKTLIARGLTIHLSRPGSRFVPIYCAVRELLDRGLHPFDLAEQQLGAFDGKRQSTGLADALHALAARGGVCLILDGLEDVTEREVADVRAQMASWLEDQTHTGGILLAFGRPGCDAWVDPRFVRLRIAGLGTAEHSRRALLRRWARGGQVLSGDGFGRDPAGEAAAELPWFQADLDSPLLIGALALRYNESTSLSRADVYGSALTHLLSQLEESDIPVAREALRRVQGAGHGSAMTTAEVMRALSPSDSPGLSDVRTSADAWHMLTRQAGVLVTDDHPPSAHSKWRWTHAALHAQVAAEDLAARGASAIADRAERAREAGDTKGLGVILGMACSLTPEPQASLEKLAAADPRLSVEALPEVAQLSAADALAFLFTFQTVTVDTDWRAEDVWNGDTLLRLDEIHAGVSDLLWQRVDDRLDVDRAAFLHYALSHLDAQPIGDRFFGPDGYRPMGDVGTRFCPVRPGRAPVGSSEPELERFFADDPKWLDLNRARELPARIATIGRAFGMAWAPVTWGEYGRLDPDHSRMGRSDEPASGISWWQARFFAAWAGCRLPTESEWEYACRAGSTTAYSFGDEPDELKRYAVYGEPERERPDVVGRRQPNRWGLHDMHGNLWEWTSDAWRVEPGHGPTMRHYRVARGGSFAEDPEWVRSASRTKSAPASRWHQVGFRVVRDL